MQSTVRCSWMHSIPNVQFSRANYFPNAGTVHACMLQSSHLKT